MLLGIVAFSGSLIGIYFKKIINKEIKQEAKFIFLGKLIILLALILINLKINISLLWLLAGFIFADIVKNSYFFLGIIVNYSLINIFLTFIYSLYDYSLKEENYKKTILTFLYFLLPFYIFLFFQIPISLALGGLIYELIRNLFKHKKEKRA